jgi:hypothetical protein
VKKTSHRGAEAQRKAKLFLNIAAEAQRRREKQN